MHKSNNFLLSSHIFSVAVCWCLNPGILSELTRTEITPPICDLFQRTHALWSSFACSFKMILVDSKNMFSETIFRSKILVKPMEAPLSCIEGHDVRGLRSLLFSQVWSSSPARAAVIRLQKPSEGYREQKHPCAEKVTVFKTASLSFLEVSHSRQLEKLTIKWILPSFMSQLIQEEFPQIMSCNRDSVFLQVTSWALLLVRCLPGAAQPYEGCGAVVDP